MIEAILDKLEQEGLCKIQRHCQMARYTTFKIGGEADIAIFPNSADALAHICRIFWENKVDYTIVGNGSNLLFPDSCYKKIVVVTIGMRSYRVEDDRIYAECGAGLTRLASVALENGLAGLEFAYGIPGSVGGAIYMNAGAYSSETSNVLDTCRCFDRKSGEICEFDNAGCEFSYRNSIFEKSGDRYVVLDAVFRLTHGDANEIRILMEGYMRQRREKQPLEFPSAGSAFKRAPGYFTAKLIDDAGLKGKRVGGAEVSTKHAGFIINRGGATAADVKALIEQIKAAVKENSGVEIESEIRIVE